MLSHHSELQARTEQRTVLSHYRKEKEMPSTKVKRAAPVDNGRKPELDESDMPLTKKVYSEADSDNSAVDHKVDESCLVDNNDKKDDATPAAQQVEVAAKDDVGDDDDKDKNLNLDFAKAYELVEVGALFGSDEGGTTKVFQVVIKVDELKMEATNADRPVTQPPMNVENGLFWTADLKDDLSKEYSEAVLPITRYADVFALFKFVDADGNPAKVDGYHILLAAELFLVHQLDDDYIASLRSMYHEDYDKMDLEITENLWEHAEESSPDPLRLSVLVCRTIVGSIAPIGATDRCEIQLES